MAVEPFLIEINGIALEKYSDLDDWRSADEGWISELENKTARIKYKAPRDDYQIRVNYDIIDLVKM
ncbi:hypothetical protein [Coriobacterium glomerans]|uniref:hypothetical protein n=1 Tax=Coriobacterium glomerans TaxID=33871 RepID=UPI0002D7AC68|nr:hypothetical protein [Coriobacterium glomerans]